MGRHYLHGQEMEGRGEAFPHFLLRITEKKDRAEGATTSVPSYVRTAVR